MQYYRSNTFCQYTGYEAEKNTVSSKDRMTYPYSQTYLIIFLSLSRIGIIH